MTVIAEPRAAEKKPEDVSDHLLSELYEVCSHCKVRMGELIGVIIKLIPAVLLITSFEGTMYSRRIEEGGIDC